MSKLSKISLTHNFTNLIPNSNFEYDDNKQIQNWNDIDSEYIIENDNHSIGCSIKLNTNLSCNIGSHKYVDMFYFRAYFKFLDNSIDSKRINIFFKECGTNKKLKYYELEIKNDKSNNWIMGSFITNDSNPNGDLTNLYVEIEGTKSDILIDSIMLIDLTEIFKYQYEPTKIWCDNNLEYFTDSYEKTIRTYVEFTNLDKFAYSNLTKQYYTDTINPHISFVIRHIDEWYDIERPLVGSLILGNHLTLDIKIPNRVVSNMFYWNSGDLTGTPTSLMDLATFKNGDCVINIDNIHENDENDSRLNRDSISYLSFLIDTIWSDINFDNWNNILVLHIAAGYKDIIPTFTASNDLNIKIVPIHDVPTNVNITVNGITQYVTNDLLINNNNKEIEINTSLILYPGNNVINITATDICGNEFTKTIEIFKSINPDTSTKEVLLTNFIGNDDDFVDLNVGTANLKYKDKYAGIGKEIDIDMSNKSHYFELVGEKAHLYRISRDNVPKIEADILQRPLNVTFDFIEKIYDGSTNITPEVRKLKINNGYVLHDIHSDSYDYGNSGIVKSTFERKVNETVIFKSNEILSNQFEIYSQPISYSDFKIVIDNIEGYALLDDENNATLIFDIPEAIKISNTEFNKILNSDEQLYEEGLYYTKVSHTNLKGEKYYTYSGLDNRYCYNEEKQKIKSIETFESNNLEEVLEWLLAIHHSIKDIKLIRNKNGGTLIIFDFINNVSNYIVKKSVIIKYNYNIKNLESDKFLYVTSDDGLVDITFDEAHFNDKNVSDGNRDVIINNLKLIGDASNNYTLSDYTISGRILKRTINPHITCLDKIYDGSNIAPFEMNTTQYRNGLENLIENDEVYIDAQYEGDRLDNNHFFTKTGNTILTFANANVGDNKSVSIRQINLEGEDSHNYNLGTVVSNYSANILKRPIRIIVNKIILERNTKTWSIDYTIENDIKEDKLTLKYNTNDSLDIKVYGGVDKNNNSIHANYESMPDILQLFFNHNKQYAPDINNLEQINDKYVHYFESEDKQYRIYSGCKVTVTNIHLDSSNSKLQNYTILNDMYETTIEII